MPRLFGTDGIRGIANVELKPTLAYALGRATAHKLVGRGGSLVVGQDTRRSGDMFVAAIAAGATSRQRGHPRPGWSPPPPRPPRTWRPSGAGHWRPTQP